MPRRERDIVPEPGIDTTVDINDIIDGLLQTISGQALQIAKLEALTKKLMAELRGREEPKQE